MNSTPIKNINILKPHERRAAFLLREKGFDIEVLIPSNTPHNKNADFLINGRIWELKSPQKNRRETIERCFKKASKQSENLLIDLHGLSKTDSSTLRILESRFKYSRSIKRLIVITKDGKLLRYKR